MQCCWKLKWGNWDAPSDLGMGAHRPIHNVDTKIVCQINREMGNPLRRQKTKD